MISSSQWRANSIAEDPNFRFAFNPNKAREFRVEGEDTAGKAFSASGRLRATELRLESKLIG
jgi:hypothetical protein